MEENTIDKIFIKKNDEKPEEKSEDPVIAETIQFFENIVNLTSYKMDTIKDWPKDVAKVGSAELDYKLALSIKKFGKEKKIDSGIIDEMINALAEGIVKTYKAEYIYLFAKDIVNVDIEKFAKAIVRIGNVEYIAKMADLLEMTVEDFVEKYNPKKPTTNFETESA